MKYNCTTYFFQSSKVKWFRFEIEMNHWIDIFENKRVISVEVMLISCCHVTPIVACTKSILEINESYNKDWLPI